jgi:hypothetical protein
MGLNLNIKRIIFASTEKKSKEGYRSLTEFEIRQISGRAGRSNRDGFVSALKEADLKYLKYCCKHLKKKNSSNNMDEDEFFKDIYIRYVNTEGEVCSAPNLCFHRFESLIQRACLFPPLNILVEFSELLNKFYHKNKKHIFLSEALRRFDEFSKLGEHYKSKNLKEALQILKVIEDTYDTLDYSKYLSHEIITTQFNFSSAPIKLTTNTSLYLKFYLSQFLVVKKVNLPQSFHLDNKLFTKEKYKLKELANFEDIYNSLEVYIWLSYKYPQEFIERELAKVMKERVSKIIESILYEKNFNVYSDLQFTKDDSSEETRGDEVNSNLLIEDEEDFDSS